MLSGLPGVRRRPVPLRTPPAAHLTSSSTANGPGGSLILSYGDAAGGGHGMSDVPSAVGTGGSAGARDSTAVTTTAAAVASPLAFSEVNLGGAGDLVSGEKQLSNSSHPAPHRNRRGGGAGNKSSSGGATPILIAVLGNLLITAIAAFLISFFPLLYRATDAATVSAEKFANSIINNAYDQVTRAMATGSHGFEGLDSAGIQDLYRIATPSVARYWLLRARLVGDILVSLAYHDGSGVFAGRTVPFDTAIAATSNSSVVWVSYLNASAPNVTAGTTASYVAEQWLMAGINTSLIPNTRIGPFATNYTPVSTEWYQSYIPDIYAFWRPPEPDTFLRNTVMRIGAQGGLSAAARYCVYMSEVNSDAISALLAAIPVSASGVMIVLHSSTRALLGANFPFQSLVRTSPSTVRPMLFTEIQAESPLMSRVVSQFSAQIEACSSSCVLDVGSSFDRVFVRVERIVDVYGLNVQLVIAMNAIDFLQEIRSAEIQSLTVTLPTLAAIVTILSIVMWLTVRQAASFLREAS